MAVTILQEGTGTIQLALASIQTLKDVGFIDGDMPLRDIDTKHVEMLVESNLVDVPPIEVVHTTKGYGLIDGYHRVEAAKALGLEDITAHCQFYPNEQDVIDAAFRANLKHGKPASHEDRHAYVLWLYFFVKLTQEEVAKRACLSQSRVSRVIKAYKAKQAKKQEDSQEDTTDKQFRSTVKRLLTLCDAFLDFAEDETIEDTATLLVEGLSEIGNLDVAETIKTMSEVFYEAEKQLAS